MKPLALLKHQIKSLLDKASFVLAIKADMPNEALRQKNSERSKNRYCGESKRIGCLPSSLESGIHALSVAPRELPYHSGYVYFELDKKHELWDMLILHQAWPSI